MGAKLNLFPTWVYLHAGTREGARALGLDARADALYMADLPRKFHALKRMKSRMYCASSKMSWLPPGRPFLGPPGEAGARRIALSVIPFIV